MTLMGVWRARCGHRRAGGGDPGDHADAPLIWPQLQGILLTALALGFFIAAMMLMPRVTSGESNFWGLTSRPKAASAGA